MWLLAYRLTYTVGVANFHARHLISVEKCSNEITSSTSPSKTPTVMTILPRSSGSLHSSRWSPLRLTKWWSDNVSLTVLHSTHSFYTNNIIQSYKMILNEDFSKRLAREVQNGIIHASAKFFADLYHLSYFTNCIFQNQNSFNMWEKRVCGTIKTAPFYFHDNFVKASFILFWQPDNVRT